MYELRAPEREFPTVLCTWQAVPAPSPQRQAGNIPLPLPHRAFSSYQTTQLAQTQCTEEKMRGQNARG
jgi:hypothetical protein